MCAVLAVLILLEAFWITPIFGQGMIINQIDEHHNRQHIPTVQAIEQGTALLPCDLSSAQPNDTVVLVVWYKEEHAPIYSYDTRGSFASRPHHWKDANLEPRSFFRTMSDPATLSIDNVSREDEGEYRCRIDYLRSPTKNMRVKLDVIVPPGKPTIIDDKGKEVLEFAGPYEEGKDMKLTCIVTGGKPRPTVKWWREGKLIESSETHTGFDNVLSSQLVVKGLKRSDQHASFTCQASNNNVSQPVSIGTSLEIYFKPLNVEILSSNNPFSADRKYEIPCQTFGSRPPAKIKWILDGQELKAAKYNVTQSISEDSNSTTSIISLSLSRLDNGRTLICQAVNVLVDDGIKEATTKLNVYYIPIVNLTLGASLNPEDIEENDDVYFVCKVDANPSAYKVLWKHKNQVLEANQKAGIIMSTGDLALQKVTRSNAGNYSCVASNVEGDGDSNTVELKIMYKPVCRTNQKRVYGVARHENASILCEVEAYPKPDGFRWQFNNSAQSIEVPPNRYHTGSHKFVSKLTYTPVTELDYGTVMCWANNLAGEQIEPCIYHIIAAGKPDPVYNCTVVNRTNESLEVSCEEGFDGGQQQHFMLEVYDKNTGVLQANVSSKFPLFIVNGLEPEQELKMVVYAVNSKGRSESTLLEGFTLKVAAKQSGRGEVLGSLGTQDQLEIAPVLGILVGCVTALLLVTVIILGCLKIRTARREGVRASRPRFLPVKDKVSLPLRSESEDLFEKDDKNPDVIPSNKDSDYQLCSAAETPGLNNSITLPASGCDPLLFGSSNGGKQGGRVSSPPNCTSPAPSNNPLQEAYHARERTFVPQQVGNEVVYAELSLARPNSLDPIKNGGHQYSNSSQQQYATLRKGEDTTIYTQIDHGRRPPPPLPLSKTSPIVSPVSSIFPQKGGVFHHREVVTVRTPLMGCQQESCV